MIESEKTLEKKLNASIKELGGLSIKLLTAHFTGLPDRLCLLPGGRLFFCEIKTTKQKPRKIQEKVHKMLRDLGFKVYIIDKTKNIQYLVEQYG